MPMSILVCALHMAFLTQSHSTPIWRLRVASRDRVLLWNGYVAGV